LKWDLIIYCQTKWEKNVKIRAYVTCSGEEKTQFLWSSLRRKRSRQKKGRRKGEKRETLFPEACC
jgi:hypothetical protein